jgi:hypothetical protein
MLFGACNANAGKGDKESPCSCNMGLHLKNSQIINSINQVIDRRIDFIKFLTDIALKRLESNLKNIEFVRDKSAIGLVKLFHD